MKMRRKKEKKKRKEKKKEKKRINILLFALLFVCSPIICADIRGTAPAPPVPAYLFPATPRTHSASQPCCQRSTGVLSRKKCLLIIAWKNLILRYSNREREREDGHFVILRLNHKTENHPKVRYIFIYF